VWKLQQTNSSVDVTTPSNVIWPTYTNATQRKTDYWWKVNVTDNDGNSREAIYHFTTTRGDPPQIALVNPSPNGTTNVPIFPSCQIWANDSEGDTLTVYWYENSTGSYELRATYNNNVSANSTTGYVFPQFTNYSRNYYWKVVVNDSYYNTTATYYFTTEPIDTSVNTISPYNITWSPLTTTTSEGTDLNNVTLYYRWSEDNQSWGGGPPQWSTIYYDNFEEGAYGNYSEDDSDGDVTINAASWVDGTYSVYLRDDTGANLYLTDAISADTNEYTQIQVDFSFVVDDFNNPGTEDWWFQYYNGSSSAWETVYDYDCGIGTYIDQNSGTNWDTNGIIRQTFYFNESQGWNLSDDFKIRFYCDASGDADDLYVDTIYINATTGPIQGTNWVVWQNASNPDVASPWEWDFNFPNSTGYYEFYSIGKKNGSTDETLPPSADALCFFKLGGHDPTIDLINPSPNGTTGVNLLPLCQVWINDTDGDTLTVYWYENTTGGWILRNTNASITTNSVVNYTFSQFANYSITYWWKVAVNDTLNNVSAVFSFTTEPLDTSVDTISPYNVNKKPLTITATNATPVDNVTLWYRYSTVNHSWATYETGVVENVNGWTAVTLDNTYSNPVVIVTGQDGADRSLGVEKSRPRIRNVGSTSFQVIITNDTGVTVTEDVGYIVMEEGHWEIDGVEVEVGTYSVTDTSSHYIAYSQEFPGNTVVVDTIQEETNLGESRYTEDSMNATGYTVYWSQYDGGGNIGPVTAGYLAIEVGSTSTLFESGIEQEVSEDPDDGLWRTVSFSNTYNETPVLFTNPIDLAGGDPTIVGRSNLSNTSVDVRCTEGQQLDAEMDHAACDIPWIVWTKTTVNSVDWQIWNGTSNPDEVSPWSWLFDFPNSTGYYEFYSIGKKRGSGDENPPSVADAGCQFLNNAPNVTTELPANQSINISLNPTLSIKVNDSEGHLMNISWYWGINSSCPNFIGTNSSVNNGTYHMDNDNNFSSNGQTYYWKVTVMDSFGAWTNETYHFKTTGVNKVIISKEKTAYALEISPDASMLYGIVNNTNVTAPIDTSWHYVVLTYDGTTLALYVDGKLQNTTTMDGSIPINGQDVLLGEQLTGTLDEIRISNTARSTSWINTSYKMTNSPTTFIRVESEQNQQYTYLSITIKNTGSATIKITEFYLIVNGTEKPIIDLQPYLYPRKEANILVDVLAAGTKRNKLITGNCISDCEEYS